MADFFSWDIKNGLNEAEVGFNEPSRDMLRALRRSKRRNTSQSCIRSWHQQPQQCHRPKSREHTPPGNSHALSLSLWYHAAWLMHIELLQLSGNSQILTKSLLNCLVFALNGVMIDCNADTWRFCTTLNAPTLFSSLQSLSFELQKSVFVNAKPDPRIHKLFSLWATFKNCEATWVSIQNDVLYSNDALFIIIRFMCII